MESLKSLNVMLRFLLEIGVLIIFGYWGFKVGQAALAKALYGLGTPILIALLWGIFLAPKSTTRLNEPWLSTVEITIFLLACLALYSIERIHLSIAFGAIYVLNKTLMLIWKQ